MVESTLVPTAVQALIKPNGYREQLLAKIEGFKIHNARKMGSLRAVAYKFSRGLNKFAYIYFGLSHDQLGSLNKQELTELVELIVDQTRTTAFLHKFLGIPLLPLTFFGLIGVIYMYDDGLLGFHRRYKKLKQELGKNYFPMPIFNAVLDGKAFYTIEQSAIPVTDHVTDHE